MDKEWFTRAKSIFLYLCFSDNGKPPRISWSTKVGRRFDNLTHAEKVHVGKLHFRSASHFVVDALRSLLFIPVILSIGAQVPKYFDGLLCYLFLSMFLSCLQAIGVTADPKGKGVVLTTKKTKCKFFMYKTTVQVKQVKLSATRFEFWALCLSFVVRHK